MVLPSSGTVARGKRTILELGSGAGHFTEFVPGTITSEVFFCSGVRLIADAQQLPFPSGSLRAIVFTDVLHHMPDVRSFFRESIRCLGTGGKVVMIEPWALPLGLVLYTPL